MYKKINKEWEVIGLFTSDYNGRFFLRQISRLTKMALKSTQNVVAGLEREGVLKSKMEGKNKYFTLNLSNIRTKSYILQAELYRADKFVEQFSPLKIFLKSLTTNIPIIVFGSYARREATKESDLDVLVLSSDRPALPFHLLPYKIHQINIHEDAFKKSMAGK